MANRERPLVVMEEIDGRTLQGSIFVSRANILAPVIIETEPGFRGLEQELEFQGEYLRAFNPWAITGGVGLYSLKRGEPAGFLSRIDLVLRNATDEEMRHDLDYFGEQVAPYPVGESPEIDKKYEHQPRVPFLGTPFYYTGPPRIVKAVIPTRVFHGGIPDSLDEFRTEIDKLGLKETGPGVQPIVALQGYRFFWAEKGRMYHLGFPPESHIPEDGKDDPRIRSYNARNVRKHLFGDIELVGDETLYYYPLGKRDKRMDASGVLEILSKID